MSNWLREKYPVPEKDGDDGIRNLVIARNAIPAIDDYMVMREIDSSYFKEMLDGSYVYNSNDNDSVYRGSHVFKIIITPKNYITVIIRGGRTSLQTYEKESGIEIKRILTKEDGTQEEIERDPEYIEKVIHTIHYPDSRGVKKSVFDISKSRQGEMNSASSGDENLLDISKLDALGGPFQLMKRTIEMLELNGQHILENEPWDESTRDEGCIKAACMASELSKQCLEYGKTREDER